MFRFFKKVKDFNWKYTLGEVSLIFVGITLAIWFNNYNQGRIDDDKKKQYLTALITELHSDHAELSFLIDANNNRMRRINLLNDLLADPEGIINCDSVQKYVASMSFINVFVGSNTVFEDLESTGNLQLIDNNDVKRSVMGYYAKVDSRKHYEDLNTRFHINTIGPFLKDRWNTGGLFRQGLNQQGLNPHFGQNDCRATVLKVEEFRSDDQLKQELMNHANFSYFIMSMNNDEYEIMQAEIDQLIELIEQE